jgi:hypothetical protein
MSQPNYGDLVALLPDIYHAPDNVEDTQPQVLGLVRVLHSILIDTPHI